MHPRLVARPHDSVRENRRVALCGGKLERSDDGDSFTSPRDSVSGPEFREPHSPVFFHHNPGRALGRLRSLPVWKRAQMPVDGCSTEMKSRCRANVETAKLQSLFPAARRHMPLQSSARVRPWRALGHAGCHWVRYAGAEAQYESPDDWRSGHVRSSGKRYVRASLVDKSACRQSKSAASRFKWPAPTIKRFPGHRRGSPC